MSDVIMMGAKMADTTALVTNDVVSIYVEPLQIHFFKNGESVATINFSEAQLLLLMRDRADAQKSPNLLELNLAPTLSLGMTTFECVN